MTASAIDCMHQPDILHALAKIGLHLQLIACIGNGLHVSKSVACISAIILHALEIFCMHQQ
jgi:hypothetical protein